jgi:hypothetical protein
MTPLPPYRGILPFRYVDRDYYFGREEVIADLVANVVLYRLVVLFGDSGVGKSSLINAGLIPALRGKGFHPERLRVRPFEAQPISVERVSAGMGRNDGFLKSIFVEEGSPGSNRLRVVDRSLEQFKATVESAGHDARAVLIFDQFEELFTLFSKKDGKGTLEDLQRRLLEMLVGIINNPRLKVKIVIAVREDYLAKLDVLAKHYPQIFDHRILLEQLDQDESVQAILRPFDGPVQFPSKLTPELADTIIAELSGSQMEGFVHPTELQIVCRRLWDTFADQTPEIGTTQFVELGRTKGIIEGFLTSQLTEMGAALRETAVAVLSNLITDSGTRDVVSKEKIVDVMEDLQNEVLLDKALRYLEDRRLINTTFERGTTFYELSSEFLIGPIQKERERFVLEQERRRERKIIVRRVKYVSLVAALLTILLLTFFYFLANERSKREEAEEMALQRTAELTIAEVESRKNLQTRSLLNNLSDLVSTEPAKRQGARDNIVRDAETNEIPIAILPLIEDIVRRKDPALADSYLTSLSNAISKTPPVDVEPVGNPARVVIQFSGDEQLRLARQLRTGLERDGMVAAIRRVSQGPRNSELRYFIATDKDLANHVAAKIRGLGLAGVQAVYVSGYENSTLVQPMQFELWFVGLPQPSPSPPADTPVSPDLTGYSLGSPARGNAWYVAIYPESPTLYHRVVLSGLLETVANMDGVSAKLYANGVKIGPYKEKERAEEARQRTIEALRANTQIKLKAEPSLTYIAAF